MARGSVQMLDVTVEALCWSSTTKPVRIGMYALYRESRQTHAHGQHAHRCECPKPRYAMCAVRLLKRK